jgi:hypothetical protein
MAVLLPSPPNGMKTIILAAAIAAAAFATPALADFFIVRDAVRADAEGEIATVCPVARPVEGPTVEVPAVAAQCFYQGRAFSNGATNPIGEVSEKGSWR